MANTTHPQRKTPLLQKQFFLPQEHGAWVFLLSPLLIGTFIGRSWNAAGLLLWIGSLAAFLLRQPVSIAVKAYSGRRSKKDLRPAMFWTILYGSIGFLCGSILMLWGYAYLLLLLIPGFIVFVWHLWLISRRAERRQIGVEIVASGALALSASAMVWTSAGRINFTGWLLFILCWLQSASSIVYAYLRLEQRVLSHPPGFSERLAMGKRSLLYSTFNLGLTIVLSVLEITPPLIFLPFAVQWLETLYGILVPAVGVKPTKIGVRQLIVSTIFTLVFILIWR